MLSGAVSLRWVRLSQEGNLLGVGADYGDIPVAGNGLRQVPEQFISGTGCVRIAHGVRLFAGLSVQGV